MNNWIETKDKLPELNQTVLVNHSDYKLCFRKLINSVRSDTNDDWEWQSEPMGYYSKLAFTHWFELPKLP